MFRKVQISHRLDSIPGARLRGWLMNHDNQPGKWEKHARVANISIVYSGDSSSQLE
jgi:hypothetical protein